MSRVIGIDVQATHVRAALLRTSYRRITAERLVEVAVEPGASLEEALRSCVGPLLVHAEAVAVALDGDRAFVHRLEVPASARRQLDDVLPFEIEAQVPVDLDQLVFDYRPVGARKATEPIGLLVAAARADAVRERIALCSAALKVMPDRVGVGPLALANLYGLLKPVPAVEMVAIVDLGETCTEVAVIHRGDAVFARTISRGTATLPDGAVGLAAELRQTLAAAGLIGGTLVDRVLLVGSGVEDPNSAPYLEYMLGVPVTPVTDLALEGIADHERRLIPRFGKAIALAASLAGKARDLDLRQGQLIQQRGLLFLQEKLPLLAGLLGAIVISFLFATWAERQVVTREGTVLAEALRSLSREAVGTETDDPDAVMEALESTGDDIMDPMPHADAFDVMLELSRGIPMDLAHDIDDLELKRGHVKLNGVVASKSDAQKVATILGKWRCADGVKVAKITQVVNSDRQKYALEFDLRCPEDAGVKRKVKPKEEAATETPEKVEKEALP